MKILAVDDDPDFLALFKATLVRLGYTNVTTAESGQRALNIIKYSPVRFDCCILDIKMPGMDGIELCRRIRDYPGYADVPIMMNTIMSDKRYVDDAFAAGATDYLTKPIDEMETKSRLGVLNMLVQERLRSEIAIRTKGTDPFAAPSYGFHDSIPMKRVDGAIDMLAMENYLKTLGIFRAMSICAVGIHVQNARAIYDLEGGAVFGEIMLDVGTCISDCLHDNAKMIGYRGAGDFVCLLPRSAMRDQEALRVQLLSYISEFQLVYDALGLRMPSVTVGPPAICRVTRLGSPEKLIDEAVMAAKHYTHQEEAQLA